MEVNRKSKPIGPAPKPPPFVRPSQEEIDRFAKETKLIWEESTRHFQELINQRPEQINKGSDGQNTSATKNAPPEEEPPWTEEEKAFLLEAAIESRRRFQ